MFSRRRRFQVVALCAIVILVLFGRALPVVSQPADTSLVGTWRVTQCPGTPDQFFVVIAFNEGGTTSHFDMSADLGNSGVGVWTRLPGAGNFGITAEEFLDSTGTGNDADSRLQFRGTIHLSGRENFTGSVTVDHLSLDGTTVIQTLGSCPMAGTRLRVIRD